MKHLCLFERYISNTNFKEWFKDSKIVDEKGDPLIVYHGTKNDFSTFKVKDHKKGLEGFYFSADPKYTHVFMGYDGDINDMYPSTKDYLNNPTHGEIHPNIVPVYLSVQNPLITNDSDIIEDIGYWKYIYDDVRSKGYDGVMTSNMSQIFVFEPSQIKSAYGNNGNFDNNKKSIIENKKNPKKFS